MTGLCPTVDQPIIAIAEDGTVILVPDIDRLFDVIDDIDFFEGVVKAYLLDGSSIVPIVRVTRKRRAFLLRATHELKGFQIGASGLDKDTIDDLLKRIRPGGDLYDPHDSGTRETLAILDGLAE